MTTEQAAPPAPAPAASANGLVQTATPNQYHLEGQHISVSYYPDGFGPVSVDGPDRLFYQDAQRHLEFNGSEIRKVDAPDLGTILSVTLVEAVDVGGTTFSVLLPYVNLPSGPHASVSVTTEGITTLHRAFVALIGHPQAETYAVSRLTGEAGYGVLPV